jgi:hypothetical protein
MMISTRLNEELNLVWGSEIGDHEEAFHFERAYLPGDSFVTRLMEHNFQYLYMLERKPISYINDDDVHQVTFSGGLVSKYDKKTGKYSLIENEDFIIADGNDRFIPQVGAGCKIFAYSREGKTRTWKLPETWAKIEKADVYLLSVKAAPEKIGTVAVTDGSVTLTMDAAAPYLIVPEDNCPTPITANFNDLEDGARLGTYRELVFDLTGNPAFKVYGANARGGFASPSVYADTADTEAVIKLGLDKGAVFHSMKIGNKGGEGRVVFHSSNPLNEDVMINLPETDQVYKFNTGWAYGEKGEVTMKIENSERVSNVLFDAVMYSQEMKVL